MCFLIFLQTAFSQSVLAGSRSLCPGDLIFTELMADPDPVVDLPEAEYLEIYNKTSDTLNLTGFKLGCGDKTYDFPTFVMLPCSYLLLCPSTDVWLFDSSIEICAFDKFPVLPNTGKTIWLETKQGVVLDCLTYSSSWYGSGFKRAGGWSLECVDLDNLSGEPSNWTASVHPSGGTPGVINSVTSTNPDLQLPFCKCVYVPNELTVGLQFSKFMDYEWLSDASHFYLEGPVKVIDVEPLYPDYRQVRLTLDDAIIRGDVCDLTVKAMTDRSGHQMPDTLIQVALPEKPDSFDVSFNELLFNPVPGGVDFIELVNRSEKCLDLSQIVLTKRDEAGQLNEGVHLTEWPVPALPDSYWVITEEADSLALSSDSEYRSHFLSVSSMPSMPDEAGNLVLLTVDGAVLDEVAYDDDWHYELLDGHEGVSLEKIDPDLSSVLQSSWVSASSLVDYSSPGCVNSHVVESRQPRDEYLLLSAAVITPDNDGVNDLIELQLNLPESGLMALTLYDFQGLEVKSFLKAAWVAGSECLYWNGTNQKGSLLASGRYILFGQVVLKSGKTINFKRVITVLL